MTTLRRLSLVACMAAVSVTGAVAQEACGSLNNAYGPYDYTKDREKLPIVNVAHFPSIVENLIRGNRGSLGEDLDYTLRAFPNHHRALAALMRWGQRTKSPQPKTLPRTIECYFDRAVRFRPRDPVVRMLYAQFLNSNARLSDAAAHLETARQAAPDNGLTQANVGLVYTEMKDYERALRQAHAAMALGFPATALHKRLVEAGQWREPQPPAPAGASAPAGFASAAAPNGADSRTVPAGEAPVPAQSASQVPAASRP